MIVVVMVMIMIIIGVLVCSPLLHVFRLLNYPVDALAVTFTSAVYASTSLLHVRWEILRFWSVDVKTERLHLDVHMNME